MGNEHQSNKFHKSLAIPFVLVIALATLAGFFIHYSTPWGPWAFSDSTEYLEAGRNVAAGRGFVVQRMYNRFVPLYLRPPFYSFVLGMMVRFGIDPIDGSRWLNIALYSALILVVGISAYIFTHNSGLVLVLSLYLVMQPELVDAFASMMTEPIFITFTILQIVLLVVFSKKNDRWVLLLSTTLAGMLWMTRYAGVANVVILGVGIMLFCKQNFNHRLVLSTLSGLIAAIPFIIWSIGLRTAGYSPGSYDLNVTDLWNRLEPVRIAIVEFFWRWLPFSILPFDPKYFHTVILLFLFFLSILIWLGYVIRTTNRSGEMSIFQRSALQWSGLLILYAFLHLLVVAATYIIVRFPKPALDDRVMLPTKITLLMGLGILFYELCLAVFRHKLVFLLSAIFLLPLVFVNIALLQQNMVSLNTEGRGYTSRNWQDLQIIEELRRLPDTVPIVSNDPVAVIFFAARPALQLPELQDGKPVEIKARFGQRSQDEAEVAFRERDAALVLFFSTHSQLMRIYGEEVNDALRALKQGLYVHYEGSDGSILFYSDPAP